MPKPQPKRNPFPELVSASIHRLTASDMRELIPDAGIFLVKNTRPLTVQDRLLDRAMESLRQSAGINRVPDLPLQSSIAPVDDMTLEIQAALSSSSPVLSGRLAASWLNGESQVINNGDGTYTLDSRVPYARINDLGGDTGKNGATHINPSYYVAAAASEVGLDISALRWVDGVLSGASGVGSRGQDVSAGVLALGRGNFALREAA